MRYAENGGPERRHRSVPGTLVCLERREHPRARLLCLPHGGGGAQAYRTWSDGLPAWLEVWAVQPPGRGPRFREPAIDDMATLAEQIVTALATDVADLPLVLFGHSVGALVAFEVARRMTAAGLPEPLAVILSGHSEPTVAAEAAPMSARDDAALLADLAALGLLPADTHEAAGLAEVILPPVRADFALAEAYDPGPDATIAAPVTVFGGADDPTVDPGRLEAWRARTTAACDVRLFPGGHFFTETAREDVLAAIGDIPASALDALPPSIALGPAEDYPVDTCLHALFRAQARATPNAVALVGAERALSFAELDAESDLLARALLMRGCDVDRTVAILMETSVDYVVAVLAILKAGGAYLPIPLVTPDRGIAEILDSIRPVSVVTRPELATRLPLAWQGAMRCLAIGAEGANAMTSRLLPALDGTRTPGPDSLAYCVMTSGTTGRPKGIACPHRGAVNSYWWRFVHLPYGEAEREACSVFFVWEVLRPLLQGRPAYVIPDDVIYDPRRLIAFLADHAITRVLFTPSLFEQVLSLGSETLTARLPALRMVILNGEVVSLALAERARRLLPHVALINDYSISECHDVTTSRSGDGTPVVGARTLPAGHVMGNVRVYILDDDLKPTPWGVPGEVYVAGPTLARGYLDLPDETAARFLPDPFQDGDRRMFRTGDVGRLLPDGQLELRGRAKFMVKLRGYSVVPSAVEAVIAAHPAVSACLVTTVDDPDSGQPIALAAYISGHERAPTPDELDDLRTHMKAQLPAYAIPAHLMSLAALPIQASTGKVDRKQLPPVKPERAPPAELAPSPVDGQPLDNRMRDVWRAVLGREVAPDDNFFDVGGHSLKAVALALGIERAFGVTIDVVDVFAHPTLAGLSAWVAKGHALPADSDAAATRPPVRPTGADIAVVAMSCRFPGAESPELLWELVRTGRESIRTLTRAGSLARGVPPTLVDDPGYVPRAAILDDVDLFDPDYFGLSERESVLMDPQHRLFLECAYEALARAGYAPRAGRATGDHRSREIGVWAGCYLPSYLVHHLGAARHLDPADPTTFHLAEIGNDKDYLPTRVAYLLGLEGPAIAVQTSCSTGLVAIAEAAAALRAGRCDAALAGASSITFPQGGYRYLDGHIAARSGHCRTFAADADGTILGDGVGVVLLRRLEDALADGDPVIAVISGFAVNNDGADRAGYSAPSGIGQARAIRRARAMAEVDVGVGYVEAHGTATVVGDPIEVRALGDAYGDLPTGSCVLGSLKANIGHANIAAGVAGFIKAAMVLAHRTFPPQIHIDQANPDLRLAGSPFRIVTHASPWDISDGGRRHAAVSSFGIGGTNAHVILAEPPPEATRRTLPPAPPSPFRHRRIWPADDMAHRQAEIQPPTPASPVAGADHPRPWPEWFAVPSLRRASPPIAGHGAGQRWLVVTDAASPAMVEAVAAALRDAGADVDRTTDARHIGAEITHVLCPAERGPEALLPIVRTLAQRPASRPLELVVLARDVLSTPAGPLGATVGAPQGSAADPASAMLPGLLLSLQQEAPTVRARVIDVGNPLQIVDIVAECLAHPPRPERIVALREGVRWVERFDELTLGEAERARGRRLLAHGPHIITGGSGRIGRVLAAHLASLGADVVLVSRHAPAGGADDYAFESADPLADLECGETLRLTRSIVHLSADVSDPEAMAELLERLQAHYGRIGGIFHAAGRARLQDLRDMTADDLADELAPKVAGADALRYAIELENVTPAFLMLFSSLAATLGGLGLGAYAAANRHLDAVAERAAGGTLGYPVISVAWDDWDFDYGAAQHAAYAKTRGGLAIAPADGLAALEAILGEPNLSRVLVSVPPLEPRIARWVTRSTDAGAAPTDVGAATGARAAAASPVSLNDAVHAAYVAILGRADIGLDDDFFALGGDSLHATEIVVHIGRAVPDHGLRVADVLDHPTIRGLALCLAGRRASCQTAAEPDCPNPRQQETHA